MYRTYKVCEVLWNLNGDFQTEYCATFTSLKKAQKYVKDHEKDWENDLDDVEVGIGVEIETWEREKKSQDNSFDDLVDSYTAWCKDKVR